MSFLFLLLALFAPPPQDPGPRPASLQDERYGDPVPALLHPEEIPRDLWYGTPEVRPGGDLLGPLMDLVRRPSSLFDFTPRMVPPFLPDRETMEFLRCDR